MKHYLLILAFFFLIMQGNSQSIANNFKEPLKDVLIKIENRFGVQLNYSDKLVGPLEVEYAQWRFQSELEPTLYSVLAPLDMVFSKNEDGSYQINNFRYYVRSVNEGEKHLARLLSFSKTKDQWEQRKDNLKECIYSALKIGPLIIDTPVKSISTDIVKIDGYNVQQVAIESYPGIYLFGSLYKPEKLAKKNPAVLMAQGHSLVQRYAESSQKLSAVLAKMGAIVFSYDMFALGESTVPVGFENHRSEFAQSIQTINSIRALDFVCSIDQVDTTRIGMTGPSGGGTQTFLLTALDDRIKVSAPVVMVSSWFYGGCACESGMPIHACGDWGTNNAEIAAMAAPRPMLVVSDGGDWTANVPEIELPYLSKIYGLYNAENNLENVHLPNENHDNGPSKRQAVYRFFAKHLNLILENITVKDGTIDESFVKLQSREDMLVFSKEGIQVPQNAFKDVKEIEGIFIK